MSNCGCKGKLPPVHRDEEAIWVPCEFEDTGILHGKYFPRRQVHPLSLAANATRRVGVLSDVRQTMLVSVITGTLSGWFESQWTGDTTEQVHFIWPSGSTLEAMVLPPGEHRFIFQGDNSTAVVATVTFMDREPHAD
jgi:hypothetical protein